MLDRLSQREKYLLLLAIALIFITLYYFYLYQPIQNQISLLKEQKIQKEKELNFRQKITGDIPSLREEVVNEKAKGKTGSGKVPDMHSVAELLAFFQSISDQHNIDLINFKPGLKNDQVNLSVIIGGEYRDICKYLLELEDAGNKMEFINLDILKGKDYLNARINLMYHFKLSEGEANKNAGK